MGRQRWRRPADLRASGVAPGLSRVDLRRHDSGAHREGRLVRGMAIARCFVMDNGAEGGRPCCSWNIRRLTHSSHCFAG